MVVILAITILGTGLIGSYTTVPAAEFSAGAIAAGETLEWITAALAGAGISISVKELLKPRQAEIEKDIGKHIDWDNYDWGDALDSPAAQDQIDELDKTINKLYGNASAKWKEMYEKSLSPTPTPETSPDKPDPSPPVTVAPIDPDTVTPPDWETLKNMSRHNGFILLEAATFWCLKEAVSNWWDSIMEPEREMSNDKNPFSYSDYLGYQVLQWTIDGSTTTQKAFAYADGELFSLDATVDHSPNGLMYHFATEEKIMKAVHYKYFKEHISKHREFSSKVLEEVIKYMNGEKVDMEDFIVYLRDWLFSHIIGEDKNFVDELKNTLEKMKEEDERVK